MWKINSTVWNVSSHYVHGAMKECLIVFCKLWLFFLLPLLIELMSNQIFILKFVSISMLKLEKFFVLKPVCYWNLFYLLFTFWKKCTSIIIFGNKVIDTMFNKCFNFKHSIVLINEHLNYSGCACCNTIHNFYW